MAPQTPFIGDHYQILGVDKDASADEIKKSFRKLARECHPDVAQDDPDAARRFARIREAYETLADDDARRAYDARNRPRNHARSGNFRMPGGFYFKGGATNRRGASRQRMNNPANDMDLEDIFGDPGAGEDFGFGGKARGTRGRSARTRGRGQPGPRPRPGRDIQLEVDVPEDTAERGGTVTLHYPRLRRTDDGELVRYDEIHDLRVPPGTRHGQTLRVQRFGDDSTDGSTAGDLVCDVRVVPSPGRTREAKRGTGPRRPETRGARTGPPPPAAAEGARVVRISVVEAILGGRISVDTPGGKVKVTVPPGSSGGKQLRLRGRAEGGGDLVLQLQISVPTSLDPESRALIERFAELNPDDGSAD